jgi:hypothetical protein
MTRPAYTALLLAVAAVAVAGCGGGDSTTESSAARGATGQQDTASPQTGTSGPTGTKRARPKRTAKSKQRSDKKTGAGESNTGSPAAPAAPTAPSAGKQKPQPHTLTPEELKEVGPGMRKYARELCKAAGLEGLAQQYNIKSGDPDDVAEAFAAGYAVALRKDVAAGCKAGLLESR